MKRGIAIALLGAAAIFGGAAKADCGDPSMHHNDPPATATPQLVSFPVGTSSSMGSAHVHGHPSLAADPPAHNNGGLQIVKKNPHFVHRLTTAPNAQPSRMGYVGRR